MRVERAVGRSGMDGIRSRENMSGSKKAERRVLWTLFLPTLLLCLFALSTADASGGGGSHEGPSWFDFTWRTVNFLILAGALYWLLAKKVKAFFADRREGIRTALTDAEAARKEAEHKFREYETKLDKATGEIDEITRMIQAQGVAEKGRIIEDARKAAEKMKEDTRARMEQEFNKASRELRIEAVRLSTQMAEELLRKNIREGDHEVMVKDYIEKVVSAK
ncbi:MAG: ATP synthase F0 subunit B [Deltaproteobacteria bacterium]|nr:ATP synthase F0 subunit B [Deltaproteobacteria bacterium]